MTCPTCGSDQSERYGRGPRVVSDMTLRRHRCRACGVIFLSVQRVVTPKDVEQITAAIEGQE